MSLHQINNLKKPWIALALLVFIVTVYTLIVGNLAVNRYMSFNATIWDLGVMTQTIWNTAHGRILQESVNLGFPISRMAVAHWELIYLPLAVIYRIFPSIPLLLYIQTFVLACGVLPIYRFAEKKLSSTATALFIAVAYLLYPALHGSSLFDIHGLTFSTTFLLFTFYFLDQQKTIKTISFAILSICCREDVALIIFMLGLFSLLMRKRWKISFILITLGVVWIIAFFTRGYFIGHEELMKSTSMAYNWDHIFSSSEFLKSPLKIFLNIIQWLITFENIKYLVKLILPVIGLCLLSPTILLISSPTLLLNLLSNWHQMHQLEYHYTATITPFIFLAAIKGMANLKQKLSRFPGLPTDRILLIIGMLIAVASIISTAQFSILRFHNSWHVSDNDKLLSKKLHAIPLELSVSTTARPGPHLANRKLLYHFPEHISNADIIVIELNRSEVEIKTLAGKLRTRKVPAMNKFTRSVFQDTTLGLKFVQDNVFCFQRGLNPKDSFKNHAFRDELPPQLIIGEKVNLGDSFFFLGFKPVYIDDRQAHFQLFWLNEKKQSKEVSLTFYLSSGDLIQKIPYEPLFGRINIQHWQQAKIICDHLFIDLPDHREIKTFSILASFSAAEHAQTHYLFSFKLP